MQSIITFQKLWSSLKLSTTMLCIALFLGGAVNAQTSTITTTYPVNRVAEVITWNLQNVNTAPITINAIGGVLNLASGTADVQVYYKTSAINGAPGPITAANGWILFGKATVTTTGTGTIQPLVTTNLIVPASSTYGFAVQANETGSGTGVISYNGTTTGVSTVSSSGVNFITGTNIGYGGVIIPGPTVSPRYFTGSITFTPPPCSGAPKPGGTNSTSTSVCPGTSFTLSPANATNGSGVTYQFQSSPTAGGTFTDIPGATSSTFTTTLTSTTFYRVVVKCGPDSTGISTPVRVSLNINSITTQPTNTSAACGSTATFTVGAAGTNAMFQWQFRVNPTSAWLTVPNAPPYSGANTATLTISNVDPSMEGYQYRAIVSGQCTGADFTAPATLTVTPLIPIVIPTVGNVCIGSGSVVPISIGNPSPAQITVPFNSAANLNIPIPDGDVDGISNTIAVSGIPSGAVISNVRINMNIPHTYVSDLMVVIKAPNGQVLNLSNLVGGTNRVGADFTNTAFSSTAVNALVTGTVPGHTGTFKPDAAGAVGAFGVPGGPTGFTPTLPGGNLNNLTSIPNGNWTLAMYDAGPPDVGTLQNWSVTITYSSAATGTFTSNAPGTIFTDSAGTIPYNLSLIHI